jgi:hypothetical protein
MDKTELKQSRTVSKSAGAKDAKSLRANANRTVEAPDMPDMEQTSLATRDGPGQEIVDRVVELRRQGKTLAEVSKAIGIPENVLRLWKDESPEFFEAVRGGFDDFVSDCAEETIEMAEKLTRLKGLRPADKVTAGKISINTRLRVAQARLPEWGKLGGGEGGLLILDVSQATLFKTLNPPGSPDGQNAKALESGRWALPPREEKLLDQQGPGDDGAGAAGPGDRAHRRARALPGPGSSEQAQGAEAAGAGHA